jgi:hypothetical protein
MSGSPRAPRIASTTQWSSTSPAHKGKKIRMSGNATSPMDGSTSKE